MLLYEMAGGVTYDIEYIRDNLIAEEDVKFIKEWLKNGKDRQFLINRMKSEFMKLSPEELSSEVYEFLLEFSNDKYAREDLFEAVPDDMVLLDSINKIYEYDTIPLQFFLNKKSIEQIASMVNSKEKYSEYSDNFISTLAYKYASGDNKENAQRFMELLESDLDKAKFLLEGGDIELLPYVKDLFYRNQVTKFKFGNIFDKDDLLIEIEKYNAHCRMVESITDERERAEYISSIDNNEMKEALLLGSSMEREENRYIVINSFKRKVNPEIKHLDDLARTMITEFFEDRLGEDYTEQMREKVDIVFNKVDLSYSLLGNDINGQAYHLLNRINIANRIKSEKDITVGILIHEYAHEFSHFDYRYTSDNPNYCIEEGMADTFADLVVNHYLEKHGEVDIDEKNRLSLPYVTNSGYDFENAWPRTMLAGLEPAGKDIKAVGEYLLGSKNKFATMVLGKEGAESKERKKFGMIMLDTILRSELYHSPELDFSNIDDSSIYYSRNYHLPLFQIQRRISSDCVSTRPNGECYKADNIANEYFGGRQFYDVPIEELSEFIRLLDSQVIPNSDRGSIGFIKEYKAGLFKNLTEEQIKDNSFEILCRIPAVLGHNIRSDTDLRRVVELALDEERKKIKEGQPIEITSYREESIYEANIESFTDMNSVNNRYINAYFNQYFKEAWEAERQYDDQQNGNVQITPEDVQSKTKNVPNKGKERANKKVENELKEIELEKGA